MYGKVERPGRSALIVVDTQEYVAKTNRNADTVVSKMNPLIDAFRKAGSEIVFVRYVDPYHPVSGIHPLLKVAPTDHIVDKEQDSAFFGTDLHRLLLRKNVGTIYVCGFYTECCVLKTAYDGATAGYDVNVVRDCCYPLHVMDQGRALNYMRLVSKADTVYRDDILWDLLDARYFDGKLNERVHRFAVRS